MSKHIESSMVENRIFKPAKDFAKKARISSLAQYKTMWGESVKKPEKFWAREAAHPGMSAQRKTIVEHPFGSIKFWQEQRAFMMKGLEKVRGEFHLSALAYNMKRVFNLVRMERLLEAVRRRE